MPNLPVTEIGHGPSIWYHFSKTAASHLVTSQFLQILYEHQHLSGYRFAFPDQVLCQHQECFIYQYGGPYDIASDEGTHFIAKEV